MQGFATVLLDGGFKVGDFTIPWSWIFFLAVIVIGMLLIRTAITLVKVAIVVGIGVLIYLGVQYLFKNFGA
ncbi:MAG: hypothetical protein V4510_00780 [bacterium]